MLPSSWNLQMGAHFGGSRPMAAWVLSTVRVTVTSKRTNGAAFMTGERCVRVGGVNGCVCVCVAVRVSVSGPVCQSGARLKEQGGCTCRRKQDIRSPVRVSAAAAAMAQRLHTWCVCACVRVAS